ncbi:hypothetical protein PUNSTDRAFT_127988 [Punctularia strigosozonata HHB-11173 SS5]|uniref:Apple domain-containing protein n=1 Tax=Punctularia strigosozonata (strain HHB-11173) TaxID=741275 RepID=R7S5V6_PUNST|nr:uncharacterized protein PUNSTDRAFT_127988 [Punctularia strigosozonata HHB-11173 SS5]EIN05131.1 hypothetical protein PUNSTDRAFT_127988 [Punctularia strigosozonata HHB-11173 SS5]
MKTSFTSLTLHALALAASAASSSLTSPRYASWGDAVDAVRSMPQTWTNFTSRINERSNWQFDIGCTGAGSIQSPEYTDLWTASHKWFSGSNTGPTCTQNLAYDLNCSPADAISQTGCEYIGQYDVWNNGIMDCYAYVLLEKAVVESCVDHGYGDCGCGVYYDYGSGKCLVATYTYHAAGPAVFNSVHSGPAEPINETMKVIHRDSEGPSYTDIAVCGENGNQDISTWTFICTTNFDEDYRNIHTS